MKTLFHTKERKRLGRIATETQQKAENLLPPWNRSGIDTKIKKADKGDGWEVHEDIIVARKR